MRWPGKKAFSFTRNRVFRPLLLTVPPDSGWRRRLGLPLPLHRKMVCKPPEKRLEASLLSGKGQKATRELEQQHYAALVNKTVDMLQHYTPAAHTVETFAEEQLKLVRRITAWFIATEPMYKNKYSVD